MAQHFISKYSYETAKHVDHITRGALDFLQRYDWPGNVRELENVLERAVVLAKSRTLNSDSFSFLDKTPRATLERNLTLKQMEMNYMQTVLSNGDWNITRAARILGINRVTLHKKIQRYELSRKS